MLEREQAWVLSKFNPPVFYFINCSLKDIMKFTLRYNYVFLYYLAKFLIS